jgi:hypothetical protein
VTLAPGDLVEGQMYITGTTAGGWKVPQGTGFPNQYLDITGTME